MNWEQESTFEERGTESGGMVRRYRAAQPVMDRYCKMQFVVAIISPSPPGECNLLFRTGPCRRSSDTKTVSDIGVPRGNEGGAGSLAQEPRSGNGVLKSGAAASLLNGCQAYSDIHQSFPLFPPVT